MDAYLLPLLILVPIFSAVLILLPVRWFDDRRNLWNWSLIWTTVTFAISLIAAFQFNWAGPSVAAEGLVHYQLAGALPWVPGFNLSFSYGVDAIALVLVLLTTVLMPIVILGSLTAVTERAREFYFWLLLLEAAMVGVFMATDIIFFYLCFEFTLVPLYFLIGVFGSTQRLRAAAMFFLYTFAGSMLTLGGVLYVVWYAAQPEVLGMWTFSIPDLYVAAQQMTFSQQAWVLAALLAGFAVKVPLWPVHTWLPLAHTEAPTAGSVVLAAVLLKLGTYGLLRFALPMTPDAVVVFAPYIGAFAVVGILYTALVCWVQRDIKKLIAYSSVSHLGFCVLGLFALDADNIGTVGSVMYMINHGFSTGALFLCVGMIYERFHTREMAQMSGLGRVMPVWSTFMVFFVMASVGLPGLNGFVGEFLTLMGAFLSPASIMGIEYAAVATLGLIVGAIYLLYMLGRVVWGPVKVPVHHAHDHSDSPRTGHFSDPSRHGVADLNAREILTLTPLALACLFLGLYPYPVLRVLEEPVGAMTAAAREIVEPASQIVVEDGADQPTPRDLFNHQARPPERSASSFSREVHLPGAGGRSAFGMPQPSGSAFRSLSPSGERLGEGGFADAFPLAFPFAAEWTPATAVDRPPAQAQR